MIDYIFSVLIAAIAFTYSVLLTEENALFNGIYNRLYVFFKTDERASDGKPVHWLFMILMYCERCIAGQMAFWYFLYKNWTIYVHEFIESLIYHFGFVSITIMLAVTFKEIYKHKKS